MEALQGAMRRVRGEVADLCARMQRQHSQAENLHAAADLVRALLQRVKLTSKLRALLADGQPAGVRGLLADMASCIISVNVPMLCHVGNFGMRSLACMSDATVVCWQPRVSQHRA